MAINAFILLNCVGLVFLVYALVNFRNEWHRYKNGSHSALPVDEKNLCGRMPVIQAVCMYSKNRNSVIPFPARYAQISFSLEHKKRFAKTIEMRGRRVSEQRASRGGKYEFNHS